MKKILITIFLAYLRLAARIQLIKIRPLIVGLTGSVGKTSLRNAIVAVLASKYQVKYSRKANSETGIPLDLLGLYPQNYTFLDWLRLTLLVPIRLLTDWKRYDVYVVEMGIDEPFPPKNMAYLLQFIKPDIGVFLNVAPVHTEQFSKILPSGKNLTSQRKKKLLKEAIAREKGKIITHLFADKIAVVNRDDALVWAEAQKSQAKVVSFGGQKNNLVRIGKVEYQFAKKKWLSPEDVQTTFGFGYKNQVYKLTLPLLMPKYYASTLAAAITVGVQLGIDIEKTLVSLGERYILPPGRMGLFAGIKQSLILDSSYNASRTSTLGALELLKKIPQKPKVVVLGDMRELGELAGKEHQVVAQELVKVVDQVVLVGPLTKQYVFPIVSSKVSADWFINSWQAAGWLKKHLKPDSVVLIKGSQNTIFTEIVVEKLLADKKDLSRLCRRGEFWGEKRRKLQVEA